MVSASAERRIDTDDPGPAMERLMRRLYPICRSITGEGLRETLRILAAEVPLAIREVATGTPVFDWTVPKEWNVRAAYIETLEGRRVVDFAENNLHILQYSTPIDRVVPLAELKRHLHSLPDHPDWIPYRTAYYAETWGFCLRHRQLQELADPAYRVVIDTTLAPGALSYGELVLPGESADEVLFSCHVCHPSLVNDNLSGIVVATALARYLMAERRRLTYRFLFIPGTIGSLAWLAANEAGVPRVKHGLVLTCVGDGGPFTYKQSRRGHAAIDRLAAHVLKHAGAPHRIVPFEPYGYDERQYCAPGFDMPVGCFMRSPNGTFPEYHTSADDFDLVRRPHLEGSLEQLKRIVDGLEADRVWLSRNPKGEPQLGRRGLYRPIGGQREAGGWDQMALLWVLNLADGRHTLLDMAERSNYPIWELARAAEVLAGKDLITALERPLQ